MGSVLSAPAHSLNRFDKYDDRVMHFTVSTGLGAGTYYLTKHRLVSYSTCLGVGVAKELYDDTQVDNSFSGKDVVFDVLGCAVGVEGTVMMKGFMLTPSYNGSEITLEATYSF